MKLPPAGVRIKAIFGCVWTVPGTILLVAYTDQPISAIRASILCLSLSSLWRIFLQIHKSVRIGGWPLLLVKVNGQ
jgi:hypothetical protein